ncbi:MAG: segregation/condensation protein A [Lachnospiraceae bacterium]|nr:segregation/condensation protein A [Lachnospiraceae bacterium]
MALEIELKVYDGPLDLLLGLIEKNKINIFDIPIVEITEQYLAYVRKMETEDLDIMSEFMVMAAELISIKCRMLLPVENKDEEDEGDPREELVRRLLEYKTYKYMSSELRDRMEDASQLFYKEDTVPDEVRRFRPEIHAEDVIGDLTLDKLHEIFRQILRRQSEKIDPVRSRFGTIEKEEVSLPDKLESVAKYAKRKKNFSFRELLEKQHSKTQVVVTFLAVLELMSYGYITAEQKDKDDDILIRQCSDMDLDQVRERFNMSDIEEVGDTDG